MPIIDGTASADNLTGTSDVDTINGLGGNDTLSGGLGGPDTLNGGDGDDVLILIRQTFVPTGPVGHADGGAGIDTVDLGGFGTYANDAGVLQPFDLRLTYAGDTILLDSVTQGTGAATRREATINQVERFTLGPGNDFAELSTSLAILSDYSPGVDIDGGAGNDTLTGGRGMDSLSGGAGDDVLSGGDGGPDTLSGGAGNDTLVLDQFFRGIADGGDGFDTLSLANYVNRSGLPFSFSYDVDVRAADGSLTVSYTSQLSNGTGTPVTTVQGSVRNVESFTGSAGNDVFDLSSLSIATPVDGAAGNDLILGGAGSGHLSGGQGNDTITGGAGDDLIAGDDGTDTLTGQAGNDTVIGGSGDDVLDGGAGNDRLDGGAGFDTLRMSAGGSVDLRVTAAQNTGSGHDTLISIEGVLGSNFRDIVTGNGFANRLDGAAGDDTIDGRAGDDTIVGGTGNETLSGGAGQDVIQSGEGEDYISGGVGSDVIDGGAGQDVLILSGAITDYSVSRLGSSWTLQAYGEIDTVSNVEFVQFGASLFTMAQFEQAAFDPYSYLAANPDIYAAFGLNTAAAQSHYFSFGVAENRPTGDFDALTYIASNRDLIQAFGADPAAGFAHYMSFGRNEGRGTDSFDALEYLARYKDLSDAFGLDVMAATRHYIVAGATEGRATTFDGDLYAASHADLTAVFGLDDRASLGHFILFGRAEGRATDTFNFQGYASRNPDLSAFSRDQLVEHWLAFGQDEGRSTAALPASAVALQGNEDAKEAGPYQTTAGHEADWHFANGLADMANAGWDGSSGDT